MAGPFAGVAWLHLSTDSFTETGGVSALGGANGSDDVTPTTTLTFRNTGAAFGIWGVPIARDAALVEAGGDLQLSAQTKIGIFYVGQLATNAQDHSVKGSFTWRF